MAKEGFWFWVLVLVGEEKVNIRVQAEKRQDQVLYEGRAPEKVRFPEGRDFSMSITIPPPGVLKDLCAPVSYCLC